jgi:GntR family transcriptional repressor for pyruvate dehydrogenase complex
MRIDLEPLASERLSDRVVARLRSKILTGAWPPDSRLPNERQLADSLGVNRSSVREALKRLEFLELVEVRHGQGSFVREVSASSAPQLVEALLRDRRTITRDLLEQLLVFRRHLTTHVVELAAAHRTPEQLARAAELIDREAANGGDPAVALEIDVEMNTLLGEASGNLMYQFLTNLFTKLIRQLGPLYYNERRLADRSQHTHRKLFEAIASGDPDRARAIVETMLGYSESAILAEAERLEAEGWIGPDAREDST